MKNFVRHQIKVWLLFRPWKSLIWCFRSSLLYQRYNYKQNVLILILLNTKHLTLNWIIHFKSFKTWRNVKLSWFFERTTLIMLKQAINDKSADWCYMKTWLDNCYHNSYTNTMAPHYCMHFVESDVYLWQKKPSRILSTKLWCLLNLSYWWYLTWELFFYLFYMLYY